MSLAVCIQFTNLIEEQSSGTLAILCALSTLKISQLPLEGISAKSSATQFHEWRSLVAREFVDLKCDNFLACPTFALYENRNFRWCNLRQESLYGLHFRAQGGQEKLLS